MAYEKLELVVATMSGEIYLARTKNGVMDTNNRRVITDEVLGASTDWFLKNNKTRAAFAGVDNSVHNLFYTNDPIKAEKMDTLLKEEQATPNLWTWEQLLVYLNNNSSEIENELLNPKNKMVGDSELVEVIPKSRVIDLLYRLANMEVTLEGEV